MKIIFHTFEKWCLTLAAQLIRLFTLFTPVRTFQCIRVNIDGFCRISSEPLFNFRKSLNEVSIVFKYLQMLLQCASINKCIAVNSLTDLMLCNNRYIKSYKYIKDELSFFHILIRLLPRTPRNPVSRICPLRRGLDRNPRTYRYRWTLHYSGKFE